MAPHLVFGNRDAEYHQKERTMEQSVPLSEQQVLISRCRQGDQQAQFCLYKKYFRSMYNVSMRIVNNSMEAEDITQESFLTAFEKLYTLPGQSSFSSWLKKIVVSRSVDAVSQSRIIFEEPDDKERAIKRDEGMGEVRLNTGIREQKKGAQNLSRTLSAAVALPQKGMILSTLFRCKYDFRIA